MPACMGGASVSVTAEFNCKIADRQAHNMSFRRVVDCGGYGASHGGLPGAGALTMRYLQVLPQYVLVVTTEIYKLESLLEGSPLIPI